MKHIKDPRAVAVIQAAMKRANGQSRAGTNPATATAIPAAIGNAIYDATGARLRSIPFTPEKVKTAVAATRKST